MRARRGPTPAFWALAAVIVSAMVVGVVSVSALLVQTGFAIERAQSDLRSLSEEREVLTEEVAALSSPGRVHRWARERGMTMPESVVVLRLPTPLADAGW